MDIEKMKEEFCRDCKWNVDNNNLGGATAWQLGLCEDYYPEEKACFRNSEWEELLWIEGQEEEE